MTTKVRKAYYFGTFIGAVLGMSALALNGMTVWVIVFATTAVCALMCLVGETIIQTVEKGKGK